MIVRLVGEIDELGVRSAVILAGGVGYGVGMLGREVSGLKVGQEVRLFVHSHTDPRTAESHLYGFLERDELTTMEVLIGLPGIGPGNAMKALERRNASELLQALSQGDTSVLRAAGLPSKAVQLPKVVIPPEKIPTGASPGGGVVDDALQALLNLGFKDEVGLREIVKKAAEGETVPVAPALVRLALAELRGRKI